MKQLLILMIGIFCLLTIMPNFVNAEVNLWSNIIVDNQTNVVRNHLFYQLTDTFQQTDEPPTGVFALADLIKSHRNKEVLVGLYYDVNPLPFVLSHGQVNYCNLTIKVFSNQYDTSGNLIGNNYTTNSTFFGAGNSTAGSIAVFMKADDTITADMDCFYNITNQSSLFEDNVLVGKITTFMPSFSCADCTQYSFEELSHEAEISDELINQRSSLWEQILVFVELNFEVWLILSWVIKIVFLFIGLTLVFLPVYYIYKLIMSLKDEL